VAIKAAPSKNGHVGSKTVGPRPVFRYRDGWQDRVPESLRDRDQWVLWRYEARDGHYTKAPLKAHSPGKMASSTEPQDWNTFACAGRSYAESQGTKHQADGVGFVFAHGGGLVGFDLDGIISPDGGIDPWGLEILGRFTPSYHEASPSGNGIKGVVKGELPGPGINRRGLGPDGKFGFEMYASGRFFTITGDSLDDGSEVADRSDAILDLYGRFKPKRSEAAGDAPRGAPLAGDDELLDRARRAKNGTVFSSLFDEGKFPVRGSHSEADFSLCCRLAFWFNRDPAAIDRVFRRSGLMRDKWDESRGGTTYGAYTIANAIGITEEVYSPAGDGDGRAIIDLTADFHLAVDAASRALAEHGDVFQRVHELVHVVRHPESDKGKRKGMQRAPGAPLIVPLGTATARTLISRVAKFRRWDQREQEWAWKAPPRDIAESVLGERNYPSVRELVGIIEAPTLRPDGSLLGEPGYDARTGLLYAPNADYPPIPEFPTERQVNAAKDSLLYLTRDFPLKADSDRAAWLASVLTLVARGGIDGPVPAFLISSNVAGSGKSLLANFASMIASGRLPTMDSYPDDPAEMEKTLVSIAMAGDRCIVFDNASSGSAIGSAPFDRAVTARGGFRGRILGKSQHSPNVPWVATLMVTGNNICTRADSLRRVVPMFMEYPHLKPESRNPRAYQVYRDHGCDLETYVARNRPKLVADALTILRGWLVADEAPSDLTPMDFPEWDRLVRRAVHFATGWDPLGSHDRLEGEDETMGERTRLVGAWRALCLASGKPSGLTAEEASRKLADFEGKVEHRPLIDTFAFWSKNGRLPDSRTLGKLLRKHKDGPTPCGRVVSDGKTDGVNRWSVSK
jgi:hypothetical protein